MMQNVAQCLRIPTVGALVLTWIGCANGGNEAAAMLPEVIHGLVLSESVTGQAATEALGGIYEGEVTAGDTYIGRYGPEHLRATLYVSRFATPEDAQAELAAMADRMSSGTGGYGHHTRATVGEVVLHSVFGHGQVHYFYVSGLDVTWLASPPRLARAAIAELLHVEVDAVRDPLKAPEPTEKVEL
ncbi:MAG TPA: hypothetical protein VGA37_06385 [Gemmatimonadales bacterium]